jgi:hypothetical protein
MPRTIVVFVTRDGHSRVLAAEIGKRLSAPVYEIGDLVKRKGFVGYMRSGAQAWKKMATPIEDPGVKLEGVKFVVLVQPIWASAICPPIRTWLSIHRGELGGVRLALLASNFGSPPARLRANYDAEFSEVFGPLAAFAVLAQRLGERERSKIISDFAAALERA